MKNFKKNGGFTLVELIVVIAILAILAAVAIPAYSGYIEKANRAGDEQLLAAVNKAFASACMTNGQDNYYRTDVSVDAIKIGNGKLTYTGPFREEFVTFYEDGTFKVIDRLMYDPAFGGFKDPAGGGNFTVAYGGGFVQVTGDQIQTMLGSNFYGEGMSSEKLMNQVVDAAGYAGVIGPMANLHYTPGFINSLKTTLGMDSNSSPDAVAEKVNRIILSKMGKADDFKVENLTATEYEDFAKQQKAFYDNALVLYTAESTSKMDPKDAVAMLQGVTSSDVIKENVESTDEAKKVLGMNQAALAYGMYYAYVNSDKAPAGANKNPAANDVTTALANDTNFHAYMNSDQGQKDMAAYLEALKVIDSAEGSAAQTILTNGFADEELIAILQQAMGK